MPLDFTFFRTNQIFVTGWMSDEAKGNNFSVLISFPSFLFTSISQQERASLFTYDF